MGGGKTCQTIKYLSNNQDNKAFNPQKETHFTWLVEHQICCMTYDKIAEKDADGMELRKIL